MQVLPTAEGGISRLKIVQKSLGVMRGIWVEPKGTLGRLEETGTMSVGDKEPSGRVPPGGQVKRSRSLMTSSGMDSGVAAAVLSRRRAKREIVAFILTLLGTGQWGESAKEKR